MSTGFRQRGAMLLALAALIGVAALYLLVMQLDANQLKMSHAQATEAALAQAKEALLAYAVTYPDAHPDQVFGYLPCPDIDGDGGADQMDAECGGADDKVVVGLLPFRQLGLADYRDSTGACLWYVVSGSFKAAMNKPTPMNWDTQGRLSIADVDGNVLIAAEDHHGAAAAAVIAAGPALPGQNRAEDSSRVCGIADAATIYANYLDGGYAFPSAPASVVQLRQGRIGAADNNDRLAWVTPREIFTRIKQRQDFPETINSLMASLAAELGAEPEPGDATTKGSKQVGDIPDETDIPGLERHLENWREQFTYVRCDPAAPQCLTVNGIACSGALIFAGERPAAGPRTAADKLDAATRLEAGNLAAVNEPSLAPPAYAFTGATSLAAADHRFPWAGDFVTCTASP